MADRPMGQGPPANGKMLQFLMFFFDIWVNTGFAQNLTKMMKNCQKWQNFQGSLCSLHKTVSVAYFMQKNVLTKLAVFFRKLCPLSHTRSLKYWLLLGYPLLWKKPSPFHWLKTDPPPLRREVDLAFVCPQTKQ